MTDRYRSDRSNRYAYSEARVATTPSISTSLWRAVRQYRPQRNPKVTGLLFLWLFGLFAVFLSPAPVKITPEKLARYDQLVLQVRIIVRQLLPQKRKPAGAANTCSPAGARGP